jgi:hypothetical protein
MTDLRRICVFTGSSPGSRSEYLDAAPVAVLSEYEQSRLGLPLRAGVRRQPPRSIDEAVRAFSSALTTCAARRAHSLPEKIRAYVEYTGQSAPSSLLAKAQLLSALEDSADALIAQVQAALTAHDTPTPQG